MAHSTEIATTCTLDTVAPGASVQVSSLTEANPQLYRKLHAMGVVAGKALTVLRRAPFGDPISISVLGYTLSLRLSEARHIIVTPIN